VEVNISHSYIGDLRVDLIAPDGSSVPLHSNTGSARDLVRMYTVQDTPALRPLLNRSVRGTWQLSVQDTFPFNAGRLNGWRIAAIVTG
jgi:subtilisin-like proprotein convertase family protein